MNAILENTTNINFLSPLEFKFQLTKTPQTNFYVQAVNIPGLKIAPAMLKTPFVKIPLIGDHIDFDQLLIVFRVDYQLNNYMEIYNWILAIGKPDNFAEAAAIGAATRTGQTALELANKGRYSDGSIIVLDGQRSPVLTINIQNMFPVALSSLMLDSRKTDVDYVDCHATFAYQSFSLSTPGN